MLPSACLLDRRCRAAASRPRRFAVLAAVVILGSATWAVENRPAQMHSSWAVGTPATAIIESAPPDPAMQEILRQVLEHTHVPILRSRGTDLSHPAVSPRVAERPTVSDGWRSTPLHVSPLLNPTPHHVGPRMPTADWGGSLSDPSAAAPSDTADEKSDGVAAQAGADGARQESVLQFRPPRPKDLAAQPAESTEEPELTCSGQSADETVPTTEEPITSPSLSPPTNESPAEESALSDDAAESPADEMTTDVAPETQPDAEVTDESTAEPATEPDSERADADPAPRLPVAKTPPPPLTRQLMNLRARVRSVLKGYYRKPLNSRENDPWEVMHGMLAYGIHSRILQNSPRGEPITAVGWLCYNQPCKRQTLMYVTPEGELRAKHGVGLQGHMGQLLAMLAQCNVSPDYPIHVGKNEFTIDDLIEVEKKTCYPKSELTFKLIALQHYLDLDEQWVNDQGQEWDFPRLIREELAQPIRGAACGGTHRLSGLSLTVKARQRRGEPLDGEYARAAEFVQKYHNYAFRLQNSDGSLSTEWFRGRGDEDDDDRRIKTTGHILEWLCYSLSDEELRQQRTIRAVWYLASLMFSEYDHEWEVGPRSHALHALVLYDERVFRPFDKEGVVSFKPQPSTANRSQRRTTSRR